MTLITFIFSNISDHFSVFSSFTSTWDDQTVSNPKQIVKKRTLSNERVSKFLGDLSTFSWDLHNPLGVDESFDIYIKTFLSLYNKHFPVEHIMVKEKHR